MERKHFSHWSEARWNEAEIVFHWVNRPVISHWISHRFSHCHITLHCYSWCLLRVASISLPLSLHNSTLSFTSQSTVHPLFFLFELHLNFSRVSHTFLCSREGGATTVRKKVRSKKSSEEVCEEEELRNWSSRIWPKMRVTRRKSVDNRFVSTRNNLLGHRMERWYAREGTRNYRDREYWLTRFNGGLLIGIEPMKYCIEF